MKLIIRKEINFRCGLGSVHWLLIYTQDNCKKG